MEEQINTKSKVNFKDEIVHGVIKIQLETLKKLPFHKSNSVNIIAGNDDYFPTMITIRTVESNVFEARHYVKNHQSHDDFWCCNELPSIQVLIENINFDVVECNLIQKNFPISIVKFD